MDRWNRQLIVIVAAAAVINFDNPDTFGDTQFIRVGKHAHPWAAGMTGHGNGAMRFADLYHHGQRQVDPAEIKLAGQLFGDTKDEDMTVFGFHLAAFEYDQAMFISQPGIIRVEVMLPVFCQDKAINGYIFGANPLAIILNFGPTVVGFDRVGM